ncbi:sensor histidine kinase [Acrocarpospora catenulata]|uniref:sensor histidine kinase n=1 Tax=Acrocarpospora catenulata TaxID=2836182 RepID=UPI001BD9F06E|nr:ATP-binding protein [Acrocarpospora catenulata]
MAGRKRSVRVKIFAILLVPVIALTVIWGFAAAISVQTGLEYVRIGTVQEHVVSRARTVLTELQNERMHSLSYLGNTSPFRADLDTQQQTTDAAAKALEAGVAEAESATPPAMAERVRELLDQLARLDTLRSQVENREISRLDALEEYSSLAELGFQVYDRLMISPDLDLVSQTKAIILVDRGREIISQQSALLAGTIGAGRMTERERVAFADLVGKRRLLYQLGVNQLDSELRLPYAGLNAAPIYADYLALEQSAAEPTVRTPAFETAKWQTTVAAISITLDKLAGETTAKINARAEPLAQVVFWRVGLIGGLGLIAVAVSVFFSFRFARKLTADLAGLRHSALELADRRLPDIVRRLRGGEDVDVTAETPPLAVARDSAEIDGVGEAFDSVRRTAVQAAVGQARLRKGVGLVFLNLARRNQSLLHRQLDLLDGLERQVRDPAVLDQLFAVDHLTTRMRRHAEGLITLSGATPGRGWRDPVSLYDVVRAAVEEVEDYLRVSVNVPQEIALAGPAVTDVIHLVAELVENATIFSPPNTQVLVRGELVARGFVLEVEDRGLGISAEELAHLNHRLTDPPEFDLADSDRLGLFVVGRLAQRHQIRVSLRPSPYGGTTAIVLLPKEIVVEGVAEPYTVEQIVSPQPALAPVPGSGGAGLPRRVKQASMAPQLRTPGDQS